MSFRTGHIKLVLSNLWHAMPALHKQQILALLETEHPECQPLSVEPPGEPSDATP